MSIGRSAQSMPATGHRRVIAEGPGFPKNLNSFKADEFRPCGTKTGANGCRHGALGQIHRPTSFCCPQRRQQFDLKPVFPSDMTVKIASDEPRTFCLSTGPSQVPQEPKSLLPPPSTFKRSSSWLHRGSHSSRPKERTGLCASS